MGLPQTPSGPSPGKAEQIEPLDLRINNNHVDKSPTLHKRMPWFCQTKPLDLRVIHDNKDSILPSAGLDNQYTETSKGTGKRQSIASTPNLGKTPSVHQFKTIVTNSHLNEDTTADVAYSDIFPSEPIVKEVQRCVSEVSTNEKSSTCATVPSVFTSDKIVVGSKHSQNLESLPVNTCKNNSNDTQSGYVVKTVKSISLLLENTTLDKSNLNTEILSTNESNSGVSTKCVHKIEKHNNKHSKMKRIAETKSTMPIFGTNQDLAVRECKHTNNEVEGIEINSDNVLEHFSQNQGGEEPSPKKLRFEPSVHLSQNIFTKPSVMQLKKTGESFLQDGKCFDVAPKLPRCRECSMAPHSGKPKSDNVLCRFYAFRKLRYSDKGFLATAGFLHPHIDTRQEDLRLWQPTADAPPPDLDLQMARFMLTHVGDQFCDLCKQEEAAISIHKSKDKTVAWKRLVPGFREMCDMCNTTLFNYHWTCRVCGFAVCIDCYKAKEDCIPGRVTVEGHWDMCVSKREHVKKKLMLSQIIAADSWKHLGQKAHEIRTSLGLKCGCSSHCSSAVTIPELDNSLKEETVKNIYSEREDLIEEGAENEEVLVRKINLLDDEALAEVGSANQISDLSYEDYYSDAEEKYQATFYSSLQNRLTKLSLIPLIVPSNGNPRENHMTDADVLEEAILIVIEQAGGQHANTPVMGMRIMTLTESQVMYPDCPHSWLCEGRLLKLSDPSHEGNYRIFQDQWKRGQPVLVSGVLKFLDEGLWQPDSFIRDFGDTKNDLVNCITGQIIPDQYMHKFWDGFQNVSEMLRDEKGNPMLLKLKDWPPGEDFAELLPSRFENLMKSLPMGEYTKRTGQLNLPSRLPSCFARPDLGPKMYIAYGSAIHPTKGTTNLHLDISDAVNVMVYVGIPNDIDREEYIKDAYQAVDEACFEMLMRRRVREPSEVPGALWHIYSARDANKIRHLLTRVAREQGIQLGSHQDPIHDQNFYLDTALRERLYKEYDVQGYAIVQCLGDAIFIPAGAPHQVRNLLNCIKIAEDFVSPENVSHCLHLTQEFRKLSDFHTNHEDVLQIKNIIYHAVKDCVSVLSQ